MQKLIKFLSAFDWVMGCGTIVYGLIWGPWWVVLCGALGLATAWFKPAALVQKYLEKKFLAKNAKPSDGAAVQQAESFYAEMLGSEATPSAAPAIPTHFRGTLVYGPVALGPGKHNALKSSHLNLYRELDAQARY